MKKILIFSAVFLMISSCKEGAENAEQEKSEEKTKVEDSNLQPLMNMYGEDSIDASGNIVYSEVNDIEEVTDGIQYPEEDLGYKLGTRPDQALANSFGEDSLDGQGNSVYPPRDTIWDEE